MHVLMSAAPSLNKVLSQHLLLSLMCSSQESVWYNHHLDKFRQSHQHECPTRPCLVRVGDSFCFVICFMCSELCSQISEEFLFSWFVGKDHLVDDIIFLPGISN